MTPNISTLLPVIRAPGLSRISANTTLNYGRQIRDQYVWEFPILPGAVYTYQQMASGRELKISGFAKGVARSIEYLQDAQTRAYDGIIYRGFEDYLKRRVLDYLCVGRTAFASPEGGPLEYLDPVSVSFDLGRRVWIDNLSGRHFAEADVTINHPIPIGNLGAFMAPLAFVIPTAMLAWLIREHDKASVDGRKLRDVIIVQGQELATQIASSIEQMINRYSGADVTKNGVDIVWTDGAAGGSGQPLPTQDLIGRLGISEIPKTFDRKEFQFEYVNEIAAALGISLRHFWNSEQATNRALEEVQEARQAQKGPSSFVRNEQRIINSSKMLKRFGSNIRMAFIEEVDVQSRETNAKVLKLYAESAALINSLAPNLINIPALFGWLQGDDILPADSQILNDVSTKNVLSNPESLDTPGQGNTVQQTSDPNPSLANEKDLDDELGYGEISMNLDGRILERREKVITVAKLIAKELEKDADYLADIAQSNEVQEFTDILATAQKENLEKFFNSKKADLRDLASASSYSDDDIASLLKLTPESEITDDQHRQIGHLLLKMFGTDDS